VGTFAPWALPHLIANRGPDGPATGGRPTAPPERVDHSLRSRRPVRLHWFHPVGYPTRLRAEHERKGVAGTMPWLSRFPSALSNGSTTRLLIAASSNTSRGMCTPFFEPLEGLILAKDGDGIVSVDRSVRRGRDHDLTCSDSAARVRALLSGVSDRNRLHPRCGDRIFHVHKVEAILVPCHHAFPGLG